jgi:hypothetical protein
VQDLRRYESATQQSVRAATGRYLMADGRVALSIVPRGQAATALPGSEPATVA